MARAKEHYPGAQHTGNDCLDGDSVGTLQS